MENRYEGENHYHEDGQRSEIDEMFRDIQRDLGHRAYRDVQDYDRFLTFPEELLGTEEQRLAAGHFVDTLFYHVMNTLPGEKAQPPAIEFVQALYAEAQEQARQSRQADSENAHQYPEYSLNHAFAAAQKRQMWLTGVLLQRVDDDYNNAAAIKADSAVQRKGYYLVEEALSEAMRQEQLRSLAAELADAEARLRKQNPVLYQAYQLLAWSFVQTNRLIGSLHAE